MQSEQIAKGRSQPGAAGQKKAGLPGLLPSAIIAGLAGIGMWVGLSGGLAGSANATGTAGPLVLDQVGEADLAGALGSMAGSNANINAEQIARRRGGCPPHLAWVSLSLAPNQPPTTVRLVSGGYISGTFPVTGIPKRVAIPYPGPYEAGRGTLILRKAGSAVNVALLPAWHVPASQAVATQDVTWKPDTNCAADKGAS